MADGTAGLGVVLGIDPGSRHMGWGLVAPAGTGLRRVASGVFSHPGRIELPERLGRLLGELERLFDQQPCSALAIEAAFLRDNPRTALVLGQARGLPIALAARRGLPVFEYAPAVIKRRIVGSGRAEKEQMREMVRLLLGMDRLPQEDEADALAVAIAHVRSAGLPAQPAVSVLYAETTAALAVPRTPAQAHYLALVEAAARTGKARR